MTTDILETLSWIDYDEVFERIEKRSRAEGITEGKAEGITQLQMEHAIRLLTIFQQQNDLETAYRVLNELEIPAHIIEAASNEIVQR